MVKKNSSENNFAVYAGVLSVILILFAFASSQASVQNLFGVASKGGGRTGLPDRTSQVQYLGNPTISDLPNMWVGEEPGSFYPDSTFARSMWDVEATPTGKILFANGDANYNYEEAHLYYLDTALNKFRYFQRTTDESIEKINIFADRAGAVLPGYDTIFGGGRGSIYVYDNALDSFKVLHPMINSTHIHDAYQFNGRIFYIGNDEVYSFDENTVPYNIVQARFSIDGSDWTYKPYAISYSSFFVIDNSLIILARGHYRDQPVFYQYFRYVGEGKFLAIKASRMEYSVQSRAKITLTGSSKRIDELRECLGNKYIITYSELFKIIDFESQLFEPVAVNPPLSGDYAYSLAAFKVNGNEVCALITRTSTGSAFIVALSTDGLKFDKKFMVKTSYSPKFASHENTLYWGVRNSNQGRQNGQVYMLPNVV